MEEEAVSKEDKLLETIGWVSEALEEYRVLAKRDKEYLQEAVSEIVDSCETVEEAIPLLFTAYYRSNGMVLWKTIAKLCDEFDIDYQEVKSGTCRTKCGRCGAEVAVKITSRAHYDNFRERRFPTICQECEEKSRKEYEEEQERQEATRAARLQELKSMPYREYLKTDEWKSVRDKALRKAKYKCELCFTKSSLNTHHKTYARRGEEDTSDLIVLCEACHAKFHDKLPKTEGQVE